MDPAADVDYNLPFSPYNYCINNPIKLIDPDGMDWYDINGTISWYDQEGDLELDDQTYSSLGKNVLVGFHDRDEEGNEDVNAARFELYLESDTEGPTATIFGNTVPSDNMKYGTLAEGLYPAKSASRASYVEKGKEDLALIINEGNEVPTLNGNPNKANSDMLTGVFFHMGNNYQESLFDSRGNAYSKGCQTSGNFPGSRQVHNEFMKSVGKDFNGNYYLRSNQVNGGTIKGVSVIGSGTTHLKPKMGFVTVSQ